MPASFFLIYGCYMLKRPPTLPTEIVRFNPSATRHKFCLLNAALDIFIGENSERKFDEIVDVIQEETRIKYRDAIKETLLYLVGMDLTAETIANFAWRIAANLPKLRAGIPVPPAAYPNPEDWLLFQVCDCDYDGKRVSITTRSLVGNTAANTYIFSFVNIAPFFRKIVTAIKDRLPNERFDLCYGLFFAGQCNKDRYGMVSLSTDKVFCPRKFLQHNNMIVKSTVELRIQYGRCKIGGEKFCKDCHYRGCPARGMILL